jgi:hypothetical protein
MVLLAAVIGCIMLAAPSPAAAQRFGVGIYAPIYPVGWGWGGYWGPYPYGYAPYGYPGRPLGEVKIKTPVGDAQIYINGSMAGKAKDLKRFYLVPGTYNVEQRVGNDVQRQKVYVIAGRSLKLEFGKAGTPSPAPLPPPPAQAAPAPAPDQPTMPPPPPPQAAPTPQSAPVPAPGESSTV